MIVSALRDPTARATLVMEASRRSNSEHERADQQDNGKHRYVCLSEGEIYISRFRKDMEILETELWPACELNSLTNERQLKL